MGSISPLGYDSPLASLPGGVPVDFVCSLCNGSGDREGAHIHLAVVLRKEGDQVLDALNAAYVGHGAPDLMISDTAVMGNLPGPSAYECEHACRSAGRPFPHMGIEPSLPDEPPQHNPAHEAAARAVKGDAVRIESEAPGHSKERGKLDGCCLCNLTDRSDVNVGPHTEPHGFVIRQARHFFAPNSGLRRDGRHR